MRMDKLTIKSQEALAEAQSLASSRGHSEILPAHLLRALLAQPEGSTAPVLQKLGAPIDVLRSELEKLLENTPKVTGGIQTQIGQATSRVLERGFTEAEALKDEYVSTEHLLLAIAANSDEPAGRMLREVGATRERLLDIVNLSAGANLSARAWGYCNCASWPTVVRAGGRCARSCKSLSSGGGFSLGCCVRVVVCVVAWVVDSMLFS